ncbi:MAG: ankyrin repeat domain-containing protein [Rickettsiaceae bacterium]|nr:ankyrin repeat domain-containing protein [Rickettsiaceae bacterium]
MDLIGGTSEYTEEVGPGSNQTPLPENPLDEVTTMVELEPNAREDENNLGKRAVNEIEFAKDAKSEDNDASSGEPLLKKSCPKADDENCLTSAKIDTQKVKKEALKSDEVIHPVLTPEQQESVNRALFKAIGANNIPAVIDLIKKQGADVNTADRYGKTALMDAAYKGHNPITALLLERGADVNAADRYGKTAIMEAAHYGHAETTRLLIDAGAEVNAAAHNGWTALMESAAWNWHTKVVQLLLERGADVNAADRYGKTALMEAASNRHNEITRILIAHGADAETTAIRLFFACDDNAIEQLCQLETGNIDKPENIEVLVVRAIANIIALAQNLNFDSIKQDFRVQNRENSQLLLAAIDKCANLHAAVRP